MAKSKSSHPGTSPSFEEALNQLETTVHDLEEGQIGLEESLARYESGVKLLRHCYNLLTNAQRRIELLAGVDADGTPVTRSIEEEHSDTLQQKARRRSRRRTAPAETGQPPDPIHPGDEAGPADGPDDVDEPRRLF